MMYSRARKMALAAGCNFIFMVPSVHLFAILSQYIHDTLKEGYASRCRGVKLLFLLLFLAYINVCIL